MLMGREVGDAAVVEHHHHPALVVPIGDHDHAWSFSAYLALGSFAR
jgi:hypothetical protein